MDTLIIEKKNEVYITADCDPNVQRELSEFFTFYVPGYKFMPAFRNRMWDGKIRLFSQKTKEIYFGLYPYIKAFADEDAPAEEDLHPIAQGIRLSRLG